MTTTQDLLQQAYAAFNRRDIDAAFACMQDDVRWPKASEGGEVHGKEELRAYWMRQWSDFNPQVEPLEILERDAGTALVRVHQVVRSLAGEVLWDGEVWHRYTFTGGLIALMELADSDTGASSRPTAAFARS